MTKIRLTTPKSHSLEDIKNVVMSFASEHPDVINRWISIEKKDKIEDDELKEILLFARSFLKNNYEYDSELAFPWALLDMRTIIRQNYL